MRLLYTLDMLRPPRTGIGRYAAEIIAAACADPAIAEVAGLVPFRLIGRAALAAALEAPAAGGAGRLVRRLRALPGAYPARQALRRAGYAWALRGGAARGFLYHEPNAIAAPFAGRLAVTVHDLSHLSHPETHPPERVAWMRRELPRALARADLVLTVSDFVRTEVLAAFALDPARVIATPLGVDPAFHPRAAAETAPQLARFGLRHGAYVLAVATLEPRKNIARLLAAHRSLPERLRRAFPLVLAGAPGWRDGPLRAQIDKLAAAGSVKPTSYVGEATLAALYAGAAVFAYPSLYEGFGLPVLEAMASGTPVVTADRTAMPEVAAGSALLVDPTSEEALAAALARLLEDPALAGACRARGLARAARLTWAGCFAATRAAYRRLG